MAFGNLKTTTIREFDGGLNVVNDDLNMDKRYSIIETNIFNNTNGTKAKRYGTKFLKNVQSYPNVTETFNNCVTETKHYIYLLYDNRFDVKVGSKMRIIHTEGNNPSSTMEVIAITSSTLSIKNVWNLTEKGTIIGYQLYDTDLGWSSTYTAEPVLFLDKIQFKRPVYHEIKKNDKISITFGLESNYLNKDLTVIDVINNFNNSGEYFTNQYSCIINKKVLKIDTTKLGAHSQPTSAVTINYNGKLASASNNQYEDFNRTSNKLYCETVDSLKLPISSDNNDLIAGHKLQITDPSVILPQTISRVIYEEVTNDGSTYNQKYLVLDKIPASLKNVTTIITKHDNRSLLYNSRIINCTYYVDKIIAVTNFGEIVAIDGQMNSIIIWNDTIAKTVNPYSTMKGWSDVTNVCFCVFNGKLTVWNGKDKPLMIDLEATIPCNYLIDAGTGSNAFVPIAKYAISFNHYLVCGNIIDDDGTLHEDRISISSKDSIGTFYSGDMYDLDNDGVEINFGTIISANKQVIKGLSRYRDRLVVGFDEVSVFGTLGQYEEVVAYYETYTTKNEETGEEIETQEPVMRQAHTPSFEDVIDNNGCISNRSYASINTELICLDYSGVPLFKRTGIYATILPGRISNLVAPEIYSSFIDLKELLVERHVFAINNPKDNQYLLFIPTDYDTVYKKDSHGNDTNVVDYYKIKDTVCYAYTINNSKQNNTMNGAWSKFIGWNFQCGCTTALNEVILINGTKLYRLGNKDYPFYADFIDDPDYPATEDSSSGKEIDFEWEFPWADFGDRAATKHSRYLSISSTGTSQFCIDFFTDYIYYNNYYNRLDPQLTLDFVAGDSVGWGNGNIMENNKIVDYKGHQNYGGGRITNNELLFAWTTKFKIGKFRIHGSSKYKLNINSITLYYQMGNIRR